MTTVDDPQAARSLGEPHQAVILDTHPYRREGEQRVSFLVDAGRARHQKH
jgi:hypothetical protein